MNTDGTGHRPMQKRAEATRQALAIWPASKTRTAMSTAKVSPSVSSAPLGRARSESNRKVRLAVGSEGTISMVPGPFQRDGFPLATRDPSERSCSGVRA